MGLKDDALKIVEMAIKNVLPDEAVDKALRGRKFSSGNIYIVAVGKPAWQMANKASQILGDNFKLGIVITKYGHVKDPIDKIDCYEAGHPIPDENSFIATQKAIDLVKNLNSDDTVIFLLSGGGSALFEKPLISGEQLADITGQLLKSGADIVEINTIRKRLSEVKGGRFAKICEPAKVFSIVLSDILGDPLDMIASGPAYPDSSSSEEALNIVSKYNLVLSEKALNLLKEETPKQLNNVETIITGSVRNLCEGAKMACEDLGYETTILTDQLNCEAKEAGLFMSSIAKTYHNSNKSLAFIVGGESVVHLKGNGKGGRNQELSLSAAIGLSGLDNCAIFSVGSDGTDGPTDAAGAYVDGDTANLLRNKGIDIFEVLENNDAYNALKQVDGLIVTGPTGTNVNDVSILLIKDKIK